MKKLLSAILTIMIMAFCATAAFASAVGTVETLEAVRNGSAVDVSGTTANVNAAVAVQVLDADDNVIGMDSFVISGDSFSGSVAFSGTAASVRAADYDGGPWKTAEIPPEIHEYEGDATCPGGKSCPASKFTDVDVTAWYHDGVHFCVENGIMNGVSDTKFDTVGNITRAQIVTMLWRLDGEKYANYAMTFKDVSAGQWYTEAIRWAASEKIVNGYDAEHFGPNNPITREQLATILYNYAKSKGQGFTGSWMFLLDFVDRTDISSWADEAVHWCSMKGIVNGKDGKVFDPQGNASRAEAACMVQRFCECLKK